MQVDHFEVFVQQSGRTLFRTHSLSVARIIADQPRAGLDFVAVSPAGADISPSLHPEVYGR